MMIEGLLDEGLVPGCEVTLRRPDRSFRRPRTTIAVSPMGTNPPERGYRLRQVTGSETD